MQYTTVADSLVILRGRLWRLAILNNLKSSLALLRTGENVDRFFDLRMIHLALL